MAEGSIFGAWLGGQLLVDHPRTRCCCLGLALILVLSAIKGLAATVDRQGLHPGERLCTEEVSSDLALLVALNDGGERG